jgi:hypothetical protein
MGSINAFFRKSTMSHLKLLFDHCQIDLGDEIDWTAKTPAETKKLIKAIGAQKDAAKNRLAPVIERIGELATHPGQVAIRSVIGDDDALYAIPSPHDRAIDLFVNAEDNFVRAEQTLYSEERRRRPRSYDGFIIDRGINAKRDDASINKFREAIKQQFAAPKVYVDIFDRERIGYDDKRYKIVQVSVFHEGVADDVLEFENADDIVHKVRNPVFEAALIYEPASGVLEVVANSQEDRRNLAAVMARDILGVEFKDRKMPYKRIDLNVLLRPHSFPSDVRDGIETVTVTSLRLMPLDGEDERLVIERGAKSSRTVWQMAENRFRSNNPLLGGWLITQAKITIKFRPEVSTDIKSKKTRTRRGKTIPLVLTMPHGNSLKDLTSEEQLIGEKYLLLWGLIVEEQLAYAA